MNTNPEHSIRVNLYSFVVPCLDSAFQLPEGLILVIRTTNVLNLRRTRTFFCGASQTKCLFESQYLTTDFTDRTDESLCVYQ